MQIRGAPPTRWMVGGMVLTVIAILALPPVGWVPAPGGAGHTTLDPTGWMSSLGAAGVLPTPLLGSWEERSGFNASLVAETPIETPRLGEVTVVVEFWPSDPSLFAPSAASRPLTVGEIADRFGLSATEYQSAEEYFLSHGLSIAHSWPDRLSLTVKGSADAVGAAFGTTLLTENVRGEPIDFPASVPSLPSALGARVEAVSGLSTSSRPLVLPLSSAPLAGPRPQQGGSTTAVTPNDIHVIYGLDSLYNYTGAPHDASGKQIALLLWGSGYNPNDLQTFLSRYYPSEFKPFVVRAFPMDGAPAPSASAVNDPSNSTQEMTLDLEWSGSEAPGATLDAIYAPDGPPSNGYSPTDPNMEDVVSEAVSGLPGVNVISMSFGSNDGGDTPFQSILSTDFAEAAQRGITVLAASGDTGGTAKTSCAGGPAPQFPAVAPTVVAVGGTAPVLSENLAGTVTGLVSEPAWSLSGGGYSTTYAAPSWQLVGSAKAPILAHGGERGTPDVSGPASQNFFFYDGTADFGSGTSFSTPMWAGLVAEMDAIHGTPLGFLTPRIYQVGAAEGSGTSAGGLADITDGQNCVANAIGGWDAATGWGTPRALALYNHIAGTFVDVNVSASPGDVAPGGDVAITILVRNATSHVAIGNLPIDLTMTGSFPGPCSGTLVSSNSTTNASGATVDTLTVPSCYFGSSVSIETAINSGGYYGDNATTVQVNLFGIAGLRALTEVFPYNLITFSLIMGLSAGLGLWIGQRRRRRSSPPPSPPPGATAPGGSGPSAPAPHPTPVARSPPPPPTASNPGSGPPIGSGSVAAVKSPGGTRAPGGPSASNPAGPTTLGPGRPPTGSLTPPSSRKPATPEEIEEVRPPA